MEVGGEGWGWGWAVGFLVGDRRVVRGNGWVRAIWHLGRLLPCRWESDLI